MPALRGLLAVEHDCSRALDAVETDEVWLSDRGRIVWRIAKESVGTRNTECADSWRMNALRVWSATRRAPLSPQLEDVRMQFLEYRGFSESLIALKKRGGSYQKGASAVEALCGRIAQFSKVGSGDNPLGGLSRTRHGEGRIRNGVKYHLSGYARLVTTQNDDICILLYTGTHDDVERWLDRRRGHCFLVDGENRVVESYVSDDDSTGHIAVETGTYTSELHGRLSEDEVNQLFDHLPYRVSTRLQQLRAGFNPDELKALLGELEDRRRAHLILDVMLLLNSDRVEEARSRLRLHAGKLEPIDEVSLERLPEVVNPELLRSFAIESPVFSALLKRYASTAAYRDWMLFMHADQERVVNDNFDGPAKLVGVSGSGKTCVVVRRAIRLAADYPEERVLIVTLNRALASLIDDLVDTCAPDDIRVRVDVRPFFDLCKELMHAIDPDNSHMLDEYAHKHREHVEEIWQEYYRCEVNNLDAEVFHPVHDSLLARGCSPEKYLREEVNWLRSAFSPAQRSEYLSAPRTGRKYNILASFRQAILDGTRAWEEKMDSIGVIDTLGLAQKLSAELGNLPRRYRCILVDEVQDFGNIELQIINALTMDGDNNLFLTGDAAQVVTTKMRRFADVGIDIPRRRSRSLSRNYRNSEDVLRAAYAVLRENLTEEMIENEDLDIKDPEASSFTGTAPTLLQAPDLRTELRYALAMAADKVEREPHTKVCISVCGYSLEEMKRYGKSMGYPVLDGQSRLDDHSIFLSDLAHTKGFEFDMVCIVNCADGVLPDQHLPEEEISREVAMLYVAMTRAKMDLCISYSGRLSRVFDHCKDTFLEDSWEAFSGSVENCAMVPLPERIEDFRPDVDRRPWRQLGGTEFLRTKNAIGLPIELIGAIRELTNGPAQRHRRIDIRWRTIGDAIDSCRKSPQSANVWGRQRSAELLELADRFT